VSGEKEYRRHTSPDTLAASEQFILHIWRRTGSEGAVVFLLFIYGNNNKAGQSIRADVFLARKKK
jgi:hypothetical protein